MVLYFVMPVVFIAVINIEHYYAMLILLYPFPTL